MRYKIVLVLVLFSFSHCRFLEKSKEEVVEKITELKGTRKEASKKLPVPSESKEEIKEKPVDLQTPITVYSDNLDDEDENNDLYVKVYPTKKENQFKLSIKFGANEAESIAYFPDPEYFQKVALRKSDQPNTCVLGFIGKEGDFHELSEIVCSTTQIKINKLKTYYLKTN